MQDIMEEFILESLEKLDLLGGDLLDFEKDPGDLAPIDQMFRVFHTIKGTAGFVDMPRQVYLASGVEGLLESAKKGEILEVPHFISTLFGAIDYMKNLLLQTKDQGFEPQGGDEEILSSIKSVHASKTCVVEDAPQKNYTNYLERPQSKTFRLQASLIERMSSIVGELVLAKNKVLKICEGVDDTKLLNAVEFVSKLTLELQENISKTRLQPISHILSGFPRLVRDLSVELGKKIHLSMEGVQTELDRQILECIKEPLMHIIRNAADHGIGTPQEREAQGKPETGNITIKAYHDHEYVKIEIGDDGKGINHEKIKDKAVLMGFAVKGQDLSLKDIENLMFTPGFSTSQHVTNISGRGVGLDIVKIEVEKVGGSVYMQSTPGKGLTFVLNFPLTIAIIPSLIIEVGGMEFAVPQSKIIQIINIDLTRDIVYIDGNPFLKIRQDLVPLTCLNHALELPRNMENIQKCVATVPVGDQVFGVIIDKVKQTEEIIVKRAPLVFKHIPLFAGSTILKDGNVVMILDLTQLLPQIKTIHSHEKHIENIKKSDAVAMFKTDHALSWIVPLSNVYRIEEMDFSAIVRDNGDYLIPYQNGLLLLHCLLEKDLPSSGVYPVIILKNQNNITGLIIRELIDILDTSFSIEFSLKTFESLGDTTLNGEVMKVLNCNHFFTHPHFKKEDIS